MTKLNLSALALVCLFLFVGCSTASKPGNCGCVEGNLCGWNFYKPADLVEGQAVHCRDLCCPQPCAPKPCCPPGVSWSEKTVAPAQPAAAPEAEAAGALETEAMEMAPPAGAASEGTADFGLPADVR